jgi:hypothetical protein
MENRKLTLMIYFSRGKNKPNWEKAARALTRETDTKTPGLSDYGKAHACCLNSHPLKGAACLLAGCLCNSSGSWWMAQIGENWRGWRDFTSDNFLQKGES